MSHQRKVYVIGQGIETRRTLARDVGAVGAEAWPFASGGDFLEIIDHLTPACLLVDLDLSDVSGLDILAELKRRDIDWPAIGVCAKPEFQPAVEAMKLGAIDVLPLPICRDKLALALAPAWGMLERSLAAAETRRIAQERVGKLTARESEVLLALLGGGSNKQIAHCFGISVRTVEMHRAHLLAKLEVKSLAEAAMLAAQAELDLAVGEPAPPPARPLPSLAAAQAGGRPLALARTGS